MSAEGRQKNGTGTFGHIFSIVQYLYSGIPYQHVRSGHALPPWHFIIEPTRACNLRCKMCMYIDWLENVPIKEQREGELSTDEWMQVIQDIHRFSLITFTGGEVFLRKDFPTLLEAASKRCFTHLISNLTLFSEEKADLLTRLAPAKMGRLGLNFMGTSVEGTESVHDEIRQRKGSFKKTIESVTMMRNRREKLGKKCPVIHMTTVMQPDNVHILKHMPRIAKEAGADVINFVTETRMFELEGAGERDPRRIEHGEVDWSRIPREVLQEALLESRAAARDQDIQFRLPRMPFDDLLNFYEAAPLDLNQYECRAAWNHVGIAADGEFGSCFHSPMGNVREHRVKELWNAEKQRGFRKVCRDGVFASCPGCCVLHHKQERDMLATMPDDNGLHVVSPAEQPLQQVARTDTGS